jgi:hypothetical protein
MPPAKSRAFGERPFFARPSIVASAPGGTTTTGQGARRATSAETLPRSDDLGPVEPTTIIAACAFFAAAASASAGWPTSRDQAAPKSFPLTQALRRSSRSATAVTSAPAASRSIARTKMTPRPSSLPKAFATRAAPLADSESSTPQIITPFMDPPSSLSSRLARLEHSRHRAANQCLARGRPISVRGHA